jgi:hypothetical protein
MLGWDGKYERRHAAVVRSAVTAGTNTNQGEASERCPGKRCLRMHVDRSKRLLHLQGHCLVQWHALSMAMKLMGVAARGMGTLRLVANKRTQFPHGAGISGSSCLMLSHLAFHTYGSWNSFDENP